MNNQKKTVIQILTQVTIKNLGFLPTSFTSKLLILHTFLTE